MILALLALVLPAQADTGIASCRDWAVVPDGLTAYTDMEVFFRIDTPRACQVGLDCSWSLSQAVGTLSATEGFSVTWTTPHDPPLNCDPLDVSLTATCTLWGAEARADSADLKVACTDTQRDDLEAERNAHSPQGGGCGSAGPVQALLLLPLGLWGVRRRLRQPSAIRITTLVAADS
ncbi:MAG: hypothetical protein ABIO70_10785 [Pseudomonadota bacterium]